MAGIFISIGCTVYLQCIHIYQNNGKLIGSILFSIGLVLVFIAKGELFTGNSLMINGLLNKTLSITQLLRNWIIVYIGNFIGSLIFALLIHLSKMNLPINTLIQNKSSKSFITLMILGILCNILVCLAVWMNYNCNTITDKILIAILPITVFVLCGFEHSVADMFYLCLDALQQGVYNFQMLLPVTIGNIIGGSMIGVVYYKINKNQ